MKLKIYGKKLRIYINRSGEVFWLKKYNCIEYRERLFIGVVKESIRYNLNGIKIAGKVEVL